MEIEKFLKIVTFGGPQAAQQAIADVEPWLRRAIHVRLHGSRLRRIADTGDVFQSLVKDLMSRAANLRSGSGDGPSLKPYLLGAVRNKIKARLRKEQRNAGGLGGCPEPICAEPDPPRVVEELELVEAVRSRLNCDDQRLFEFRRAGCTWEEVAQRIGRRPDTLRMRFRRSLAAAIREMSK